MDVLDETLSPLSISKLEQIRGQGTLYDWSSLICDGVRINDLDSQAIVFAKQEYKRRIPNWPRKRIDGMTPPS